MLKKHPDRPELRVDFFFFLKTRLEYGNLNNCILITTVKCLFARLKTSRTTR